MFSVHQTKLASERNANASKKMELDDTMKDIHDKVAIAKQNLARAHAEYVSFYQTSLRWTTNMLTYHWPTDWASWQMSTIRSWGTCLGGIASPMMLSCGFGTTGICSGWRFLRHRLCELRWKTDGLPMLLRHALEAIWGWVFSLLLSACRVAQQLFFFDPLDIYNPVSGRLRHHQQARQR